MNETAFIIAFIATVLIVGTLIFLWWRGQYGAWAEEKRKQARDDDATVVSFDEKK